MTEKEEYKIHLAGSFVPYGITVPSGRAPKAAPVRYPQFEVKEVSNKEVKDLLKGLLLAFENSSTDHYFVKKARTSMMTTKNAEGKLEVSLGLGVFKLFDADGKVTGETKEGIEIEIERRD